MSNFSYFLGSTAEMFVNNEELINTFLLHAFFMGDKNSEQHDQE